MPFSCEQEAYPSHFHRFQSLPASCERSLSKTFEEHLQSIETVFERMQESNIALKLSKCIFASHKVDFLGFVLSNSGIRPQSRLTEAISKFEQPKTKKELKGFLGLAGFYRAFIRDFANIAEPLNNLTSDKIPFVWTDECTNAFSALKRALLSHPVLRFPNLQQEFVVEVDASNYAVGGILSQKADDDELHPVAYFSTALQQPQRNWSATTKEAFALIVAVRHWHVYLAGTHFTLMSDHNPLTHLRKQKDPRGKFGRWITELEEYDYSIRYVPGKENIKADTLSKQGSHPLKKHNLILRLKKRCVSVCRNGKFPNSIERRANERPHYFTSHPVYSRRKTYHHIISYIIIYTRNKSLQLN